MKNILMLHGVNHNMYGHRNPEFYGTSTLEDINTLLIEEAKSLGGVEIEFFQSNYEGAWVDKINEAFHKKVDAVLMNPAAWSFYSLAIHDALEILECPIVEIHMSNIFARTNLGPSVTAPVASCMIAGLGAESYPLALRAAIKLIEAKSPHTNDKQYQ